MPTRSSIPLWETMLRTGLALIISLASGAVGRAQEPAPPVENTSTGPILKHEDTRQNLSAPCVDPAPVVSLEDYEGPLKKTVGVFARKLERKAVHHPHYKPGARLCSLEVKDKFILFVEDSVDPVTFGVTAFNAGLDQASDNDPSFGQGASGYGKRFGANFADQASFKFFKDFAYPSLFSEDPRYYRVRHGDRANRFLHAVKHTFVAHHDNGTHVFNYSEWLGTISAVTLSNLYHPGNERGLGPAAQAIGLSIVEGMGFDILREFWPEISRKFKLPFRGESNP